MADNRETELLDEIDRLLLCNIILRRDFLHERVTRLDMEKQIVINELKNTDDSFKIWKENFNLKYHIDFSKIDVDPETGKFSKKKE